MQRLRHPIRSIREPFGKAGLTVAILALVLAMVGGAWAAVGLNSKQKKEVTKIAKKYAGKPGAAGTAGTNGTNGTNGKDGAKGDKGEKGDQGEKGDTGDPWTAGGTLPENATETGYYSVTINQSAVGDLGFGEHNTFVPISFDIPLAHPLGAEQTHYVETKAQEGKIGGGSGELCEGKTGSELEACEEKYEALLAACPGTGHHPQAASGHLCVYVLTVGNIEPSPVLIGAFGSPFIRFPVDGNEDIGSSWHFRGSNST